MLEIIISLIGLFLTREISNKLKDAILGSIISTLLLLVLLYLFKLSYYSNIVFGISFIGMTSTKVLRGLPYYLTAPTFILLLSNLQIYFDKVGGLLGFSAFCSVCIMTMTDRATHNYFIKIKKFKQ